MGEIPSNADRAILEWYLHELMNDGWRITHRTDTTAHVVRGRRWNIRGLVVAVVLAALGVAMGWTLVVIGGVVLCLIVVQYICQRPRYSSITTAQAREAARLLEGHYQERK